MAGRMMKRLTSFWELFVICTRNTRSQITVFVCITGFVVFSSCGDWQGRAESGVCYQEEHLDDPYNCGCNGPCPIDHLCLNGECMEEITSCGNGACDTQIGETAINCPTDCIDPGLGVDSLSSSDSTSQDTDEQPPTCSPSPCCGDGVCDDENNETLLCPEDCR